MFFDPESSEFCCLCLEEFPVAEEPTHWHMGELRPLSKAPELVRRGLGGDIEHPYLCGNCYFDLTDDF